MIIITSVIIIVLTALFLRRKYELPYEFNQEATIPIRGLLACLIVIHHICMSKGLCDNFLIKQMQGVGGAAVTLFFFMTGYGLQTSLLKKADIYLKGFWQKRVKTVVIPFLIAVLMYQCIAQVYALDTFATTSTLKSGSLYLPYSWFIYEIIICYIIFYFTARIVKPQQIPMMMTIFIMIGIIIIYKLDFGRTWYRSTVSIPFGFLYAICERKIKQFETNHFYSTIIVLILYGVFSISYMLHTNSNTLINACNNAILPIIITYITYQVKIPKLKPLTILGAIAFYIYILHGLFIPFWDWAVIPLSILSALLLHKTLNWVYEK